MPNQLNYSRLLQRLIAEQHIVNPFSRLAYRDADMLKAFKGQLYYKPGETIDISLPIYYQVTKGLTVSPQAIVDAKYPITVDGPWNVAVDIDSLEAQRRLRSYKDQYINPATMALGAKLATITAEKAASQIVHFIDNGNSFMDGFPAITAMDELFASYDVPETSKRYFGMSLKNYTNIVNNKEIYNSFNRGLNEKILRQNYLGEMAMFDTFRTKTIYHHICGTHSAPGNITVKTAVSSGNQIVLTGFTANATGVVKANDHGTFTQVDEYDNILNRPSERKLQFVVKQPNLNNPLGPGNDTYNANADGDVTLNIEVIDNQGLINSGPRMNFVVAGASPNEIPAGSIVTFVAGHGPDNKVACNVVFSDHGLVTLNPPMEELDTHRCKSYTDDKYMISLRFAKDGDVLNSSNVSRLDSQLAVRWIPRHSFLYFTPVA